MRILVIDADVLVARAIGRALRDHDVVVEHDATSAMAHFVGDELAKPFDIVLCDYKLHGMNGREVLAVLRKRLEPPAFIFLSGYDTLLAAADTEADAVLRRPIGAQRLRDTIAKVAGLRARVVTRDMRPLCEAALAVC
jgi:CheY-like chemotaxis protein